MARSTAPAASAVPDAARWSGSTAARSSGSDDTGPLWTLYGAIDDATSEILALTLQPTEDRHGYMMLMRDLVSHHGIPAEMYGDRSGILNRNDDHWSIEEELAGKQSPEHFGRMLGALANRFIAARSRQAKEHIECL